MTVLERLAAGEHRPLLVVTRPDRPRGRGRKRSSPPVAEAARALGIVVDQPDDVNAAPARERIAAAEPEVVCICAYGGLLKEPLLSDYELFNLHPSLLPRWRGAAPIARAIEAGDESTGVSIMRPIEELDAGPVFCTRAAPIRPDDDYGSLSSRLAAIGGELLVEALERRPEPTEQPDAGSTYAEKIGPEDRRLDPALGAVALERRVRALRPHIGAYAELVGGDRLGVIRASVASADSQSLSAGALTWGEGRLLFGCADGALELLEVKPAGGRAMDGAAFARGHARALTRRPDDSSPW